MEKKYENSALPPLAAHACSHENICNQKPGFVYAQSFLETRLKLKNIGMAEARDVEQAAW